MVLRTDAHDTKGYIMTNTEKAAKVRDAIKEVNEGMEAVAAYSLDFMIRRCTVEQLAKLHDILTDAAK